MVCLVKVTSAFMEEIYYKCLCRRCSTFEYIIYGLCQRGLLCKEMELVKKMIRLCLGVWEALLRSSGSEPCLAGTTYAGWVNPTSPPP